MPVSYIMLRAILASRNIVFWDEFETALELILKLDAGAGPLEILGRFFALTNEHRIVMSRLLFAASYWITGSINFHVVGAIGNLCLIAACVRLVAAAGAWSRGLRLGAVLALFIFQLENFENFLWSGASIDHFQVVMHAVAAIAAAARGSRAALLAGMLWATLASFTLVHGCLVWPVGAFLLAHERRWRHLAIWSALGLAVLAAFFHDFEVNPAHRLQGFGLITIGRVALYWLALLGGPPAFGSPVVAPVFGLLLLATLAFLGATGAARREPTFFFVALYATGALALVAVGRVDLAGNQLGSRYLILGSLAWAVVIFMLLERDAAKAPRRLLWALPVLAAFNLAASLAFLPQADYFAEARDRAASRFLQNGDDTHKAERLHPQPGRARALLELAAQRGVYVLPRLCDSRVFVQAQPSTRILGHIDERTVSDRAVYLGGWAAIPEQTTARGQIHVVLHSEECELVLTTLSVQRPDVANAHREPRWLRCGFRFVVPRSQLPAGDFQIGLLIENGGSAEYWMTSERLSLGAK